MTARSLQTLALGTLLFVSAVPAFAQYGRPISEQEKQGLWRVGRDPSRTGTVRLMHPRISEQRLEEEWRAAEDALRPSVLSRLSLFASVAPCFRSSTGPQLRRR